MSYWAVRGFSEKKKILDLSLFLCIINISSACGLFFFFFFLNSWCLLKSRCFYFWWSLIYQLFSSVFYALCCSERCLSFPRLQRLSLTYSFAGFIVLGFRFMIYFELICISGMREGLIFLYPYRHSVGPISPVGNTSLSSTELPWCLFENQLAIYVWVYFKAFCSTPLSNKTF